MLRRVRHLARSSTVERMLRRQFLHCKNELIVLKKGPQSYSSLFTRDVLNCFASMKAGKAARRSTTW
jgi:hypothetical protein